MQPVYAKGTTSYPIVGYSWLMLYTDYSRVDKGQVRGLVSFLNWALIIFAALLGSMLIVRGFVIAFSQTQVSTVGSLGVIVLTAIGIFYHYRQNNPKASTPAAPPPTARPCASSSTGGRTIAPRRAGSR